MKIKAMFLTAVLSLSLGTVTAVQPVSAARHYRTTPVSLRGKWTTPRKNGYSQYLHITKYIFYVAGYKNGHKQSGAWGVSGHKFIKGTNRNQLFLSKHRSSAGYWTIGANGSDGLWNLKRVHHNGRIALKSWGYNLGNQNHPTFVTYYYHK